MSTELRHALDNMESNLEINPSLKTEFLHELHTHFEAVFLLSAGLVTPLAFSTSENINLLNLTFLTLVTLSLLISPALLRHRTEQQRDKSHSYLLSE